MYFKERLYPLDNGQLFAISLFDEGLQSCYVANDTQNLGYAYLASGDDFADKASLLALCCRYGTLSPREIKQHRLASMHASNQAQRETYKGYLAIAQQKGWHFPTDAIVAKAGVAILIYGKRDGYRIVDLIQRKILHENKASRNQWMAIHPSGEVGLFRFNDGLPDYRALEALMMGMFWDAFVKTLGILKKRLLKPRAAKPHYAVMDFKTGRIIGTFPFRSPYGRPLFLGAKCWFEFFPTAQKKTLKTLTNTGATLCEYTLPFGVSAMAISEDNTTLAFEYDEKITLVAIFDIASEHYYSIKPHQGVDWLLGKMTFDPSGSYLLTQSADQINISYLAEGASRSLNLSTNQTEKSGSFYSGDATFSHGKIVMIKGGELSQQAIPYKCQEGFASDYDVAGACAKYAQDKAELNANDVTPENFKALLEKFGLAEHYASLAPLLKPTLVCHSKTIASDKGLIISRFGGWPDLKDAASWPHLEGKPMRFIAQFNLENIGKISSSVGLPHQGLLSVFFAEEAYYDAAGTEENKPYWKVLYHHHLHELKRIEIEGITISDAAETKPMPHQIQFALTYRLPAIHMRELSTLNLSGDALDRYKTVSQLVNGDEAEDDARAVANRQTLLLGYPYNFQMNPLDEQAVENDYRKDFKQDVAALTQLFQFPSHEAYGKIDFGEFYFYLYIDKGDLESACFDHVLYAAEC